MEKFDVVEWMAHYGHTSYKTQIANLENCIVIEKLTADIEQGGDYSTCAAKLADYEKQIRDIRQQAQDRYDDWVSDVDF